MSTQLVKLVTKNLQSRIISLRTNKIKQQLDYSKKQYKQKQVEFETLQNSLAEFKDSNIVFALEILTSNVNSTNNIILKKPCFKKFLEIYLEILVLTTILY